MSTFLIVLSLLLHGITFAIIFMLYQKIQQNQLTDQNYEKRVKETEDLFNSYLLEIKDENERFLQSLANLGYNEESTHSIEYITNQGSENINNTTPDLVEDDLIEPIQDDLAAPSKESQMMYLYNQGYTVEEIAKKLNKGNTEVELTVKFNQKIHQ